MRSRIFCPVLAARLFWYAQKMRPRHANLFKNPNALPRKMTLPNWTLLKIHLVDAASCGCRDDVPAVKVKRHCPAGIRTIRSYFRLRETIQNFLARMAIYVARSD